MAEFRFIHSSDLHLGRRFAAMPEEIRPHLAEARHGAIARLAEAARAHGAAHVLLAGDVFDTPTPSPRVLVQALNAFGAEEALTWWVLPGNHDSLGAEALWAEVAAPRSGESAAARPRRAGRDGRRGLAAARAAAAQVSGL